MMPTLILRVLNRLRWENEKWTFFHKNKTWQDARNRSSGYENPDIFEQALINSKKEKSEKSQSWINLFDDIKKESSAIDIIDFGGGLGDKYFRYKDTLKALELNFSWNIIEQNDWVNIARGQQYLEGIKFCKSLDEVQLHSCDVLLIFSSSICYLENPNYVIKEALKFEPKWVFIDRIPFSRKTSPGTQKAKTDKGYYKVPIWFFKLSDLLDEFSGYAVMRTWREEIQPTHIATFRGFSLKRTFQS